MGELIISLIEKMTGAEIILKGTAFLVAFLGFVRMAGEFFIQLGQMGGQADKENWLDSIGAFLRKSADLFGKGLAWFGIGNKK